MNNINIKDTFVFRSLRVVIGISYALPILIILGATLFNQHLILEGINFLFPLGDKPILRYVLIVFFISDNLLAFVIGFISIFNIKIEKLKKIIIVEVFFGALLLIFVILNGGRLQRPATAEYIITRGMMIYMYGGYKF